MQAKHHVLLLCVCLVQFCPRASTCLWAASYSQQLQRSCQSYLPMCTRRLQTSEWQPVVAEVGFSKYRSSGLHGRCAYP